MVFPRYLLQNHSSVFCHPVDPLKAMGLAAPSVSDQTSPVSVNWFRPSRFAPCHCRVKQVKASVR